MSLSLTHGVPRPLGVTRMPDGSWNFALFAQNATAVDLCFFSADEPVFEQQRIRVRQRTGSVWHVAVQGISPGQLYGYRVHGAWEPPIGHRYNANKLLIDPYARALTGPLRTHASMCDRPDGPTLKNSAADVPKCVVVSPEFDWEGVMPPRIPWSETVVYEMHVKGATMGFPGFRKSIRGTYTAVANRRFIQYLKELGVTAVQLMPVHQFIDDGHLLDRGLTNYWGYQPVGYFAPEARYASTETHRGAQVKEFKSMVKALHRAGIEVILDVVYNHTGEGSPQGPTVCFRGIDNMAYYRHEPKNISNYRDFTGCGNTVDVRHPYVLQLILDSLRYWVQEMHVDGFRFDLAATLGRETDGFFRENGFFKAVHQDPVLSQVKLIAEPWDLGPGGYQVGSFPEGWAELNGKYRDTMRAFWLGNGGLLPEFASRLTGSEDLYGWSRRAPTSSVNFVTSHDGFTLKDLVSYNQKHNHANGENNRDGDSHNQSFNHGVEGPTEDEEILDRRDQHRRNLMATMVLSLGTPFILAGDERGRTQQGNNNAYCQDNEISWTNWKKLSPRDERFHAFVRHLIAYRKANGEFRRTEFFRGQPLKGTDVRDVVWLDLDGEEFTSEKWTSGGPGAVQVLIHERLLIVVNGAPEAVKVVLPPGEWKKEIDTSLDEGYVEGVVAVESPVYLAASCLHVYEHWS